MRLLILSREFPPGPGGIGTHAYELARQLSSRDWDVAVVSPQDYAEGTEIAKFNASQPFRIATLPSGRGAVTEAVHRRKVLAQEIRQMQPDVLLASGQRSVWLAACVTRQHRVPWVAVGHGTEFGAVRGWRRRITRWAFRQADAVVCVSRYTWNLMQSRGIRPAAGEVIPNGADETRFQPLPSDVVQSFRHELGMEQSDMLLTVGNVTSRKGQDVVIQALPRILEARPNTHYFIAGMGTQREEFETLAKGLGVADHVHFLGRVSSEALVKHVNACDLFVMTSRTTNTGDCEGYGIAVVEAALAGKPAVVSDNSGLVEAIVDGQTGLACKQGNAASTTEAIVRLLEDSQLRNRMAEAARRRAESEQTWSIRVEQYDRLLRGVASATRSNTMKSRPHRRTEVAHS